MFESSRNILEKNREGDKMRLIDCEKIYEVREKEIEGLFEKNLGRTIELKPDYDAAIKLKRIQSIMNRASSGNRGGANWIYADWPAVANRLFLGIIKDKIERVGIPLKKLREFLELKESEVIIDIKIKENFSDVLLITVKEEIEVAMKK